MIARRLLPALGILALISVATPARALAPPVGPVVLTIDGNIANVNVGKTAAFTMAMLEALPQHTFKTKTPWYPKAMEFTGPLLRDLLAAVGASGSKVRTTGLDDYKTVVPLPDSKAHDIIVARLINGKPMPVREKGPLFLIYPFDSRPELHAELYYNRCTWQLIKLTLE